jgi:hypothetical protein
MYTIFSSLAHLRLAVIFILSQNSLRIMEGGIGENLSAYYGCLLCRNQDGRRMLVPFQAEVGCITWYEQAMNMLRTRAHKPFVVNLLEKKKRGL